jgi:hypothetical protein
MTTPLSATLLTLPTKLRHQILKYAFLDICTPTEPPSFFDSALDIQLTFSSNKTPKRKEIAVWSL